MRNLVWTPDFNEYREKVLAEYFDEPLITTNAFYSNLIDYVLVNRSPIFYDISEPREHFSFSGAYHFQTIRRYLDQPGSKTRQALFFLHDFTHSLFPLPQHAANVSLEEFTEQFIYQERIASTETEVMAYYRVPGLREKIFPDEKIYFDVLKERGITQPNPAEFLEHRNLMVTDAEYGQRHLPEEENIKILQFFQLWKDLTPKWCGERWRTLQSRNIPEYDWERSDVNNYEKLIKNFTLSENNDLNQRLYERNTIRNLNLGLGVLKEERRIKDASEIQGGFDYLEGKAFFPEDIRKPKKKAQHKAEPVKQYVKV